MIKYEYRDLNLEISEPYLYLENRLEQHPRPAVFENTVSYEDSESRHLRSFECSFFRCNKGYEMTAKREQSFTALYIASGSFYYNGLSMSRGDAVFIEPYFEHSFVCREDMSEAYVISWEGDITVHIAQMMRNFTSDSVYKVGFNDSVNGLVDSIIYNKFLDKINIKQLAVGFTDMALAYFTRAVDPDPAGKKPADLIARAKSAIETGYADLTVEQLANLLYVNSKYLSKAFRKHTGRTPKQYITETKMTHAEHYLISTEYPIQKISEIVGYNNYTNFYTAFKGKYGVAPEEYRRLFSDHDTPHKVR